MPSFAELGVSNAVVRALAADRVTEPFAVQSLVLPDILSGRDVLARSPTGSGKTLAFGIPLVDRVASDGPRPAALILAPTRELATQIAADLRNIAHARALRITAVYGGVGLVQQGRDAAHSHIIVATPGRLEDQLQRGAFDLRNVRTLVLDEADRMLDMGFRPAVDRIVAACPEQRQTLFFSATLDGEAGRVARQYTHDAAQHEHGPTARRTAEEIEHRFVPVRGDRLETLISELESDRDLALVFVRTKRGADRLVKRLGARGHVAVAMHGNKSQRQRETALARFESGHVDTLVATDVAARGIDVAGVSHVINFDPPEDHETYVHRVGRTGRAGRTGIGITLVDTHERREIGQMARRLGIAHALEAKSAPTETTSSAASPAQAAPPEPRYERPESSRPEKAQRPRGGQRPKRTPRPDRPERRREPDAPPSPRARRRKRNQRARSVNRPAA